MRVPVVHHNSETLMGVFFDGETAQSHEVTLVLDEGSGVLRIRGAGIDIDWALEDVRQIPDQAGQAGLVLRVVDNPAARLLTAHRELAERFPARHRRIADIDSGRILRWAAGAIASVALIIFVLVPTMADQMARFIPPAGEKALGDATLQQIRKAFGGNAALPIRTCNADGGRKALERMEAKLSASVDLPVPLTVTVLDHKMVNAFALPGGHVVLMRGLIDAAETPEEVAAVFAHEMGHVVSRDPTRHALRSAGSIGVLGLLLGDFAGGTLVLFLAEQLIEAKYSQAAEADADSFAHEALIGADISPSALGDMFEQFRARAGKEARGIEAHFMSHPHLSDRIAAAGAATPEGFEAKPVLEAEEWLALRAICDQGE